MKTNLYSIYEISGTIPHLVATVLGADLAQHTVDQLETQYPAALFKIRLFDDLYFVHFHDSSFAL
jgi:hypothetical protein